MCMVLTKLDLSNSNTINVNKMNGMFAECFELEYLDLSNFDTSNVLDMAFMFDKCHKLKEIKGLNNFKIKKDAITEGMFDECGFSDKFKRIILQMNGIKEETKKKLNVEKKKLTLNFISTDQRIKCSLSCI